MPIIVTDQGETRMLIRKEMPHDEAILAVKNGDFSADIRNAAPSTAIILTQSWCSEWKLMNRYLDSLAKDKSLTDKDIAVWQFVYDGTDYFQKFRTFKEEILGNDRVPYVRFYRDGTFVSDSNFLGKLDFLRQFN
jgi:hypothetical protein